MFANESEEKFADILDYLDIEWEYEPTIFVIKELDGTIKKGFRPDFYLPEHDLYIEISTTRSRTKKRKKLSLTLEIHTDADIILLLSDKLNELFTTFHFLWPHEA